ncbi:MAG: HAD family phosphatase [Nitrospira defluvii]|nr:HAD family phosphatase [Nitrospira defluvii]
MSELRAIIFDFDGVIADTEPLHFAALRQVLAGIDIALTETEYYTDYLGFDDRGCFMAALRQHHRDVSPAVLTTLMRHKALAYLIAVKQQLAIFPGVRELVRDAADRYPLAIASGALRNEIELILEEAGLRKAFRHITSAEDVTRGKPAPDPFLHAMAGLNEQPEHLSLTPDDCLVIEDSLPGIRGARAAGMKVLAVANTHTVQDLGEADAITHSLADTRLSDLQAGLWGTAQGRA